MSVAEKRRLRDREAYWLDVFRRVAYGEPVEVQGMARSGIGEAMNRTRELIVELKRRIPDVQVRAAKTETGWRLFAHKWHHRTVTPEQWQEIRDFAQSEASSLFVRGLAVLDVEQTLREIAIAAGVQLRAEYAVWHLPGGKTDRACWILKGGAQ